MTAKNNPRSPVPKIRLEKRAGKSVTVIRDVLSRKVAKKSYYRKVGDKTVRIDPDLWEHSRNPWIILQTVSSSRLKTLAGKYIDPSKMYYVVAGDAKTQLEPLEKIGFGKPELVPKK